MDNQQWFEQFRTTNEFTFLHERPIAYFCAEFALSDTSPTYAGGLGVLAADVLGEAVDQKIPLVAVGLFYHEGYLHHELYAQGTLLKHPVLKRPPQLGFEHAVTKENSPVMIRIPIYGRQVHVIAWEKQLSETVRIFLLDTDVVENDEADRSITNRLYVGNKETRFKQEMVLGIGGLRILSALGLHPSIYHLNEGHSALLSFELAHHEMQERQNKFADEIKRAKQHIVFTNHTLVAARNDLFNTDMATALLNDYSVEIQVPVSELVALGAIHESSVFSMTMLALRMAEHCNAVSKLHAEKASDIWPDFSMIGITNGIHLRTWDKIEIENSELSLESSREILWKRHQENKKGLLQYIKEITGLEWGEDDLILGWARRFVAYKRPLALFQEKEKLLNILNDSEHPVRIVFSGSAHESDLEGAKMLAELQQFITTTFQGKVVYLPDYNVSVAKKMIAGCDVWLNTPVIGFEACGTSGMKACLNGVLPCTTKDGWAAETDFYKIGWVLDNEMITHSLLDSIEHKIIPLYFYRDTDGFPGGWVENMKNARDLILNNFTSTRMLKEYFSRLYLPSLSEMKTSHH